MYDCIHCGDRSGETRKSEFSVKLSKFSIHPRFQRRRVSPRAARLQGFSIIEAMVGFVILGITITALFGGFSFGYKTIKSSQEEVRADQILVQKMETVRLCTWPQVVSGYIPTYFTNNYSSSNAPSGVTYVTQITVTPFASAGNESYSDTLRQVTATISWFSDGITHTRTMNSLISQNGLLTYKPGT